MMQIQKGFTLFELAITNLIIGILLFVYFSMYGDMVSNALSAYNEKHNLNNKLIVQSLINYASSYNNGVVPAPYTGSGYVSTIYNPADTSQSGINLTQTLQQQNIPQTEINDDGTGSANVRVYQLVNNLTQSVPLFASNGALATLTYQYGVIYLTGCPKSNATCNPTPATGIPGVSTAMTSANYNGWAANVQEGSPAFISTLNLQKQMLATTADRLNRIRDYFFAYLNQQRISAAAADATNWYPTDTTSLAGASPATNQGCRDGWYSLTNGNILNVIGLSASEYSTTAWKGAIQFCRDFDVTGTKAANAPPHYAALRILANVSSGLAPDPAVSGNNIFITF